MLIADFDIILCLEGQGFVDEFWVDIEFLFKVGVYDFHGFLLGLIERDIRKSEVFEIDLFVSHLILNSGLDNRNRIFFIKTKSNNLSAVLVADKLEIHKSQSLLHSFQTQMGAIESHHHPPNTFP